MFPNRTVSIPVRVRVGSDIMDNLTKIKLVSIPVRVRVGSEVLHNHTTVDAPFQYPCGCEVVLSGFAKVKQSRGFNTREGERWFCFLRYGYCFGYAFQYPCGCEVVLETKYNDIINLLSFNTLEGVRWFSNGMMAYWSRICKFQYPCGCEVVPVGIS